MKSKDTRAIVLWSFSVSVSTQIFLFSCPQGNLRIPSFEEHFQPKKEIQSDKQHQGVLHNSLWLIDVIFCSLAPVFLLINLSQIVSFTYCFLLEDERVGGNGIGNSWKIWGNMKIETEVGRKCRTVALVSLGFIHVPDVSALISA